MSSRCKGRLLASTTSLAISARSTWTPSTTSRSTREDSKRARAARCDFRGYGEDGLLSLTVFNLYNRRNVWYKEFQPLGEQLIEENIPLMGLTFNASLTFRF
jgi:hypothetical protein